MTKISNQGRTLDNPTLAMVETVSIAWYVGALYNSTTSKKLRWSSALGSTKYGDIPGSLWSTSSDWPAPRRNVTFSRCRSKTFLFFFLFSAFCFCNLKVRFVFISQDQGKYCVSVQFCLEFRDTFIRRGTNGGYLPTLNTISKTFTTKAVFLDALAPLRPIWTLIIELTD